MDLRITVDDHDAERRIRRLAVFLSDLRPFWPMVVPLVTSWWRRQFETEGAFSGRPWQPLAATTISHKIRAGLRLNILQATGQAKQAASRPRRYATPRSLTLTIDDTGSAHGPVLQYHQEGAGVPKRPLVFGDPLPGTAAAELQDAADRYVRDLLRRI